MAKLTAKEIEQHHRADWLEQDADHEAELRFIEAEYDECIEEPYDYAQDAWMFEEPVDYHDDYGYDPYPCDDDFY